jgi:hypothetical protein
MIAMTMTEALPRFRKELRNWRVRRLARKHPAIGRCIDEVRSRHLTYLSQEALWDLASAALDAERKAISGVLLEAGCALGGSAIVLAHSKSPERPLLVFDVFGQIPRPSENDGPDVWKRYEAIVAGESPGIAGDRYYGYEEDLLGRVERTFSEFGLPTETHRVRLFKGLYRDTLRLDGPVALAHIDCDWYESVLDCLREIEPRLVRGGTLVIDDYDKWSGCRKAVDEYFETVGKGNYQFVRKSRLHVVKTR